MDRDGEAEPDEEEVSREVGDNHGDEEMMGEEMDEFPDDEDEDEAEREEQEQMAAREREQDVHVRQAPIQRTAEDEEFEREFGKLLQESVESRKYDGRRPVDVAIPANLIGMREAEEEEAQRVEDEDGGPPKVVFQMLVRRGNKQQVKPLAVPTDCSLAVSRAQKKEEGRQEHDEMKRLVLQYEARERREEENLDVAFSVHYSDEQQAAGRGGPPGARGGGQAGWGGRGGRRGQHFQLTGFAPRHRGPIRQPGNPSQ